MSDPSNITFHPVMSATGTFSLDFPIAEDYIEVEGTIVHHGNGDGMGIQFKKVDGKDK